MTLNKVSIMSGIRRDKHVRAVELSLKSDDDERRVTMVIEFRNINQDSPVTVVERKGADWTPIVHVNGPNLEPLLVLYDKGDGYALKVGIDEPVTH